MLFKFFPSPHHRYYDFILRLWVGDLSDRHQLFDLVDMSQSIIIYKHNEAWALPSSSSASIQVEVGLDRDTIQI